MASKIDPELHETESLVYCTIESDYHYAFPGQVLENSTASEQSKIPIDNCKTGSNTAARIDIFPNTSCDYQKPNGEWKASNNSNELLDGDLSISHQSGDAGDIVSPHCSPVSQEVFARDSELHGFCDKNLIQHDSPLPEEFEDASRYFQRYDLHGETNAAVLENDAENFDHPLNVHESDDTGHIRRQQWPPASAETTWLSEAGRFWSTQYRPVTLIRRDITPLPDVEINALAYTDSSDVSSIDSLSPSPTGSHQSDTATASHLLYTKTSEEQPISEQASVHPSQMSSKLHENFTMEDCRTLQNEILGNSRINSVVAGVSFGSNQIRIEYVSNPTFDIASFKAMLLEILKLDEEQINLIEWTTDRCVRRTSVTPASNLAHTSCTKIGAAVCINNLSGHFAIVCGHDKSKECPVEEIDEDDPNIRRPLGVVEYSLFRDNDRTKESMDVALINLGTKDTVKPYINCCFYRPNEGRRNVRVYIKDTYDIITNRKAVVGMPIQTYSVFPVQGVITGYPVIGNVLPHQHKYERPLYNGIEIQTPDFLNAIHEAGDSGMLVTTTVNLKDITRDYTRDDYYTAPVYVVGMLVASNNRYSMALPMCQTINDLLGYMNEPDQVIFQGGRRPASITFDNPLMVRISGALRASARMRTNSLCLDLGACGN